MISLLSGTIAEFTDKYIVIDVQGLGYKVFVTNDSLHSLKKAKNVKIWTHLAVRENALDLYGFTSRKERDFFELLITVSGIGPKSALNILSLIAAESLANAIQSGSTTHLVKVSGIGKKTAEKIVLELKDKLGSLHEEGGKAFTAGMSSDADTIEALRSLGYSSDEAREALKNIDKNITDTGAKVKAALKILT